MARALKVCTVKDCPELARNGKCPAHRRAAARARKGNASDYSGNTRWRAFAKSWLRRYPMCVTCGKLADVVDHIDGRGPRGPRGYDPDNLQSMCRGCHSKKTVRQDGGFGRYYQDGGRD